MTVTRLVALVGALSLATVLGCVEEPTRPTGLAAPHATRERGIPTFTVIHMFLSASTSTGSPANRVTIRANVVNASSKQVWGSGCCGSADIGMTVLGPDGKAVLLSDPRYPFFPPDCPCGPVPLRPGENLSSGFTFTGTLFVPDSPTYPSPTYAAPAGRYTVVARFGYWTEGPRGSRSAAVGERSTTFDWRP